MSCTHCKSKHHTAMCETKEREQRDAEVPAQNDPETEGSAKNFAREFTLACSSSNSPSHC